MTLPADPETPRAKIPLTPFVRFLLWDYERGSLAYELACLVILLLLVLVPSGFWGDPLGGGGR